MSPLYCILLVLVCHNMSFALVSSPLYILDSPDIFKPVNFWYWVVPRTNYIWVAQNVPVQCPSAPLCHQIDPQIT